MRVNRMGPESTTPGTDLIPRAESYATAATGETR
jgi:hypothetical protein